MSSTRPVTPVLPRPGEPGHLVLVEHDRETADLIVRRLTETWPQVRIACVSGLLEAEVVLGPQIDCLLLDIALPDAPGSTPWRESVTFTRTFRSS